MPPHKVKRGPGRPKKKFGGEQPGTGRPSGFNPDIVGKICDKLIGGLPFRYACLINGISYETGLLWTKQYPKFLKQVDVARTLGIEKYAEIATKQGAGWKILKSLDKGREFSDEIKVTLDEEPVEVVDDSGTKSII